MASEETNLSSLFLRACRSEAVEHTPIWIMRQAGRYLPEYREVRARVDFLTACQTPEIACELTLQPVRKLGVDAAILFSDILIVLPGMGVPVVFDPGPKLPDPIRTRAAIESLRVPDARQATPYVLDAVRLIRTELAGAVPLIGFAGAPFTVATYLVEGGGSKSFSAIKSLLYSEPDLAHLLLRKCADTIGSYLGEQVHAGAQAAMLFDTWAGILSPEDYRTFALPYARQVFHAVRGATDKDAEQGADQDASRTADQAAPIAVGDSTRGASGGAARASGSVDSIDHGRSLPHATPSCAGIAVPRIYYAGESAGYLDLVKDVGAEVIGLDWRLDLDAARRRLGPAVALQGNLDPAVLLAPRVLIEERARDVLARAAGAERPASGPARGHIFNLGHGILPETPPENALFLVETVHRLSAQ